VDYADGGIKMTKKIKTNKTVWLLMAILGLITAGAVVNKRSSKPEYDGKLDAAAYNNLEDIIKSAQSWNAAFKSWYGKAVPDFTVTDINGRQHSLSDYQGRNVLVVFWATWCPACKKEIPHLIELRKEITEDELAIIAISNEKPGRLKDFADSRKINYTIASIGNSALPSPFADVSAIPTTFFVDKNGKIKLAAMGLVTLKESIAILEAER
jgi:peroxiredoxin